MLYLLKTNLAEIEQLRNEYLRTLPEFQELYLELMIKHANFHEIIVAGNVAGYVITTNENALIEFYLIDAYIPQCSDYFKFITRALSVEKIYCKSFDYLLLGCCLLQSYPYTLLGLLYRDFHETKNMVIDGLSIRLANENDIPFLLQQEDGLIELYETPELLKIFIDDKKFFLFFKQDVLLGCGTMLRTHSNWDYYDIGVWVNRNHRKQGIGTFIISYLRTKCLNEHGKPSCGCAIENIASQKTIEKSGFFSKHKMIVFEVK